MFFAGFVGELSVCEYELCLAPRDVRANGQGIWMVLKARKAAEVTVRKLDVSDRQLFDAAMKKELGLFVSSEAIRICSSVGIPPE